MKAVEVSYDDEASLISALKGQQFLAIALGVSAAPDLHAKIVAAAGKAGVPFVMPNVYGYPIAEPKPEDDFSKGFIQRIKDIEDNGFSSAITLACGFWYEWSLATGERWFGFTIAERKVTFFDDGKRTIAVSTWDQCGRALAALLSLPESRPGGASSSSPSLADFKNKTVLINSFRVSQRDMLDSLHRVLGTTDADWEITYEASAKRVQDGTAEMQKGDMRGFAKSLYGAVFVPDNVTSDYVGTDNEVLKLPKEDLDEATKRTVEMVQNGWNPFGV